jgi:molybdenum cofactor biosynthesis protein B
MSSEEHKAHSPKTARCAVLTVSDSRDASNDVSGALMQELLVGKGHTVTERRLVPNVASELEALLRELSARDDIDAILCTGGTGLGPSDLTAEVVENLLEKKLPGFGELFRFLSYQEIGTPAMLSRAVGGAFQRKLIFAMPGSSKAVRLALEKLLLPELGHLVGEATGKRKKH